MFTNKTFTYGNLLPDVSANRPIFITGIKIECNVEGAVGSGTPAVGNGCKVVCSAIGQPFTAGAPATGIALGCVTGAKTVSSGNRTVFFLKPKLPGNKNFVEPGSTDQLLVVQTQSLIPTTIGLILTTYYRYDNDPIISIIA